MGIQVNGLTALISYFNVLKKAAKELASKEAWTGTVVYYGPMLEFGTQNMPAIPHWEVAAERMNISAEKEEELFLALTDPDEHVLMLVAIEFEAEVKKVIREKGLIDTGNYRASIVSGFTEQEVASKSASNAIDPSTVETSI